MRAPANPVPVGRLPKIVLFVVDRLHRQPGPGSRRQPELVAERFHDHHGLVALAHGRMRHETDDHPVAGAVPGPPRKHPALLRDHLVALRHVLVRLARALQRLRVRSAVQVHCLQLFAPPVPGAARVAFEVLWTLRQAIRRLRLTCLLFQEFVLAESTRVALNNLNRCRFGTLSARQLLYSLSLTAKNIDFGGVERHFRRQKAPIC